tara:strand:- start:9622 stop:11451 length:1830 start_codon:yes stop_codon:yes gene_type:complete
MPYRRIWSVFIVVAASGLSALWLMDRKVDERQLLDPGSFAPDRFNRWEFPAALPFEVTFEADRGHQSAFLFAMDNDSSSFIWFVRDEPLSLPKGVSKDRWGGGWLIGAVLSNWSESPGEMAAHWAPRSPGKNMLLRKPNGEFESVHWLTDGSSKEMSTSWVDIPNAPLAPLSSFWTNWFLRLTESSNGGWKKVGVGSIPAGSSWMGHDSLMNLTDGSWIMAQTLDGEVMAAIEMADSSRSVGLEGWWRNGLLVFHSGLDSLSWNDIRFPENDQLHEDERASNFDFGFWEEGRELWGVHAGNDRVVWHVESDGASTGQSLMQASRQTSNPLQDNQTSAAEADSDFAELDSKGLGLIQNHRTGKSMELVWEDTEVLAKNSEGAVVWRLEVAAKERPVIWEVDLYRNRKYQAVVASGRKVHVIDALGREVKGFPKQWSQGFSAVAVLDYDRNRQYRFLTAAPNGELFNFRKEGERTPGWNFKPRPGRYITSLEHVRVANKDYIFAGQDDNSVRFLRRSGEDRFDSPLQFPSGQIPVFRLGASLESSTVLFFDSEGVLQERTIGGNTPKGMSGLTQGYSVILEDRTGDGIPEIVVQSKEGEQVWSAGNQRIII